MVMVGFVGFRLLFRTKEVRERAGNAPVKDGSAASRSQGQCFQLHEPEPSMRLPILRQVFPPLLERILTVQVQVLGLVAVSIIHRIRSTNERGKNMGRCI